MDAATCSQKRKTHTLRGTKRNYPRLFAPYKFCLFVRSGCQPAVCWGTIHGVVKSGNIPIPGVTVTATGKSPQERPTTWTNGDGRYELRRSQVDGLKRVQSEKFSCCKKREVMPC